MNWLSTIAGSDFVQSLGWALVHFSWQGFVIALVFAVVLALLHKRSANARYLAGCIALAASALSPIATFTYTYCGEASEANAADLPKSATDSSANHDGNVQPANTPQNNTSSPASQTTNVPSISAVLAVFVLAWLLGVVLFSLWFFNVWLREERCRSFGVELADERLRSMCSRLAEQLKVRVPVSVLLSSIVDVPMVIGWLRPSLLLPAALVTNLSPSELEALFAHELAHVRRHDYVVHLLQCVVKTFLFYHPAVWWISHQMTIERENCCDDIAVELGNKIEYAQALTSLDKWRNERFHIALAASGASLQARLARLDATYIPSAPSDGSRRSIVFGIAVSGTLTFSLIVWQAVRLYNRDRSVPIGNVSQRSIEITNLPKVVVSHPPVPFDQLRRSETNPQEILWDGDQILKFTDRVPSGVRSKSVWIRTPIQDPLQIVVIQAPQSPHSSLVVEWKTPAGTWTSDSDGGSGRGGRLQILLSDRWVGEAIRLNIFPHSTHDFDGPTGGEYIVCVRRLRDVKDIDPETIGVEASPIALDDSGRAEVPRRSMDDLGQPITGPALGIDHSSDLDVFQLLAEPAEQLNVSIKANSVEHDLTSRLYDNTGVLITYGVPTSAIASPCKSLKTLRNTLWTAVSRLLLIRY